MRSSAAPDRANTAASTSTASISAWSAEARAAEPAQHRLRFLRDAAPRRPPRRAALPRPSFRRYRRALDDRSARGNARGAGRRTAGQRRSAGEVVMPGLVPGIPINLAVQCTSIGMAGTSPAMTTESPPTAAPAPRPSPPRASASPRRRSACRNPAATTAPPRRRCSRAASSRCRATAPRSAPCGSWR